MCLHAVSKRVTRVSRETAADREEEIRRDGKAAKTTGDKVVAMIGNLDSVVAPFRIVIPRPTVVGDIELVGGVLAVRVLQVSPINIVGAVVIKEHLATRCKTCTGRVVRSRGHMI